MRYACLSVPGTGIECGFYSVVSQPGLLWVTSISSRNASISKVKTIIGIKATIGIDSSLNQIKMTFDLESESHLPNVINCLKTDSRIDSSHDSWTPLTLTSR